MIIHRLLKSDIHKIVVAFAKSNWTEKPSSIFEQYLEEQNNEKRIVWVAYINDKFAGYITLKWQSKYQHFSKENIPEISDLNVLPAFRNSGVGSALLDKCEKQAATKSSTVGIGVGLYSDYGSAHRLYCKRGYVPDGYGVTYNYEPVIPGDTYPLDDELVLWFTKKF